MRAAAAAISAICLACVGQGWLDSRVWHLESEDEAASVAVREAAQIWNGSCGREVFRESHDGGGFAFRVHNAESPLPLTAGLAVQDRGPADIWLGSSRPAHWRTLSMHEFGHVAGLGHSDGGLMYGCNPGEPPCLRSKVDDMYGAGAPSAGDITAMNERGWECKQ